MRTSFTAGFPISTFDSSLPSAICTSSTRFSGTKIRRMAVHFCPHLVVISFLTSLINRSNSGVPGTASSPSTVQLSESASILKGTDSSMMRGCAFNCRPVEAEPVKVTTSCDSTVSRIVLALPQISCSAPSGKIPDSMISRTTTSVRKEVAVAGFTTAGTPAIQLTAHFSNMPQTGKLKALMWIATPRFGTMM